MISASDREKAIMLINEAVSSGSSLTKACKELGVDARTYYRWIHLKKETGAYDDLRPKTERKEPANKLSPEERKRIIANFPCFSYSNQNAPSITCCE
ncbi:helix-turn-helix domain-containing protein [Blautia sp. HCP3S3_D9]|uniref:helix-turn-helix domain-containing protein n=1 Tax=Blautia sp. HCP3S3_D9 TaxID=3438912 RepID=UPI003F89B1F1